MKLILLMIFGVSALVAQPSATPEGMRERAGMRDLRYCEIIVAKRHGLKVIADVYNTIGLNDCPAAQWKTMDAARLKAELKADQVVLNGPRHFMMDRNALKKPGDVATFDGMQMRRLAQVEMGLLQQRRPYTENTVDRESQYVFDAGKYVYELRSPDGHLYIMQSYSQEIDANLKESDLVNLARKLKLPKGWTFTARKVDRDLVVRNTGGKAHVLQDDLRDSYQRLD